MAALSSAAETSSAHGKHKNLVAPRTIKLPIPSKTGIPEVDEAAKTQRSCLESNIDDMMSCPQLIMPVFNFIRGEKKTIESRLSVGSNVAMFAEQTSLAGLEEDYKIWFVISNSDLNGMDLAEAMAEDSGCLNCLFQFGTQLPMKQKLPAEFLVRACLNTFVSERVVACGRRLAEFKSRGGFNDRKVAFARAAGCYNPNFEDGILVEITHWNGDNVAVNSKVGLTTEYILQDNHDDFAASFVMHPLAPIRLAPFFGSKSEKKGPWAIINYAGVPKLLQQRAAEIHKSWALARDATCGEARVEKTVRDTIDKQRAEKRGEAMNKARVAAKEALATKRQRRSINLNGP